jgi:hypothetical protein
MILISGALNNCLYTTLCQPEIQILCLLLYYITPSRSTSVAMREHYYNMIIDAKERKDD